MSLNLLKLFRHNGKKNGKFYLPNPQLEYRIVFKKGAVEAIKKVKGWTSYSEMANALGITRQYLSMLRLTRVSVTHTVITRLAVILGNVQANWWVHFEIVPYGVKDTNHPTWNYEKERGRMPYKRYSLSAYARKHDYDIETEGVCRA